MATLCRLERLWQQVLHAGFLLLCLRFLVAATGAVMPNVGPVLVLAVGGCVLGCWLPQAALLAFTVFLLPLNGLGYVGLAGLPAPLSVVFSGIFAGWIIRQLGRMGEAQRADPEGAGQGQRAEGGATDSLGCRATGAGEPSDPPSLYELWRAKPSDARTVITVQLVTDVLITVVLLSLAVQLARHHAAAGFWTAFRGQPVFGYADPLYFITSAFIWLQGLFFFRMLRSQDGNFTAWAKLVLGVAGGTLAAFYLFQYFFRVPDPTDTISCCSPLEDIHSFGSIAVAVFAFGLASWVRRSWAKTALNGLYVIGLLVLVVASWSRAAWMAGAFVLLLVAWMRLPRRWMGLILAMGAIAVVGLNANANRMSWNQNLYLHRLITLVRFESPLRKDPARVDLYEKALGMIRSRPMTGHGIGSFYLVSTGFARPGDPYAKQPDFAHNFLLQMAAELGVPAALLFLALILFTLWQGARRATRMPAKGSREPGSVRVGVKPTDGTPELQSGGTARSADSSELPEKADPIRTSAAGRRSPPLEILGVAMALVAYLITQMTANALNIYVSNQFFFWLLMAALLAANSKSDVESPESKVKV